MDEGKRLDLFGVQDLRQGSVFAPLAFNTLFPAALHVAVELFCANADVVRDKVYTKVENEKGRERERWTPENRRYKP